MSVGAKINQTTVATDLVGAIVTWEKWYEHQWFLCRDVPRDKRGIGSDWNPDKDFICKTATIRAVWKDKDGAINFLLAAPSGEFKEVLPSFVKLAVDL